MDHNIDQPSDIRSLIQSGYRYALSLTHHQQDAEDLIQQSCLRVLKANDTLVSKNYLFTAIRNLFIDSGRRHCEDQLPENYAVNLVDPTRSHVTQLEQSSEIEGLLRCLSIEQRECLYLNCVEGYTAAEIAILTDQPRGTVLSHLARAKQRLRTTPDPSHRVEAT